MNEQDQLQNFLDNAYVRSHSKYTVLAYDLGVRRFKKFLVYRHDSSLQQITSKLKDKTLDVCVHDNIIITNVEICTYSNSNLELLS